MIVGDFDTRADEANFGSLLSSIKKAAKKVTKAASSAVSQLDVTSKKALLGKVAKTTVGSAILAPIIAPTAAALKATSWAASKTGIKPLKALESKMHAVTTRSPLAKVLKTGAVEGAMAVAAGATILTGGGALAAVAAALPGAGVIASGNASYKNALLAGAGGIAAGQVVTQGSNILDMIGQNPPSLPSTPAQQDTFQQSITAPPSGALATGQQQAAQGGGAAGPLLGAGAGFLVGGPLGAVVGLIAGSVLSKKG